MKIAAVIQARTGSSRMPNKSMLDLHGRLVLGWVVRAAQMATGVDQVVVATTYEDYDDSVEEYAKSLGCDVIRGSETDVLARFIDVLDAHQPDAVVRLTADCPLLDPRLISTVADTWRSDPTLDLVSTVLVRSLPRGLDVELVTASALRDVDRNATGVDRVHVTSGVYREIEKHSVLGLVVEPARPDLRVTLDTTDDYALLQALVPALPGGSERPPHWREVVDTLAARPELVRLNADVQQKAVEEG